MYNFNLSLAGGQQLTSFDFKIDYNRFLPFATLVLEFSDSYNNVLRYIDIEGRAKLSIKYKNKNGSNLVVSTNWIIDNIINDNKISKVVLVDYKSLLSKRVINRNFINLGVNAVVQSLVGDDFENLELSDLDITMGHVISGGETAWSVLQNIQRSLQFTYQVNTDKMSAYLLSNKLYWNSDFLQSNIVFKSSLDIIDHSLISQFNEVRTGPNELSFGCLEIALDLRVTDSLKILIVNDFFKFNRMVEVVEVEHTFSLKDKKGRTKLWYIVEGGDVRF